MTRSRSRRQFLRDATAVAAPLIVSRRVLGGSEEAPSDRIGIGHIGVGNQGSNNLQRHFDRTVAVCDVDSSRAEKAAETVEKKTGRRPAVYGDYRKLLEDPNVDAVVVTTPDHWHALVTVDACAAGKHVYCEKPLSLTVADGQAMVAAARRYDRVVQTGSQQRSGENFRVACELARNGAIGKIHTVRVGISGNNFKGPPVPDTAPPPELDYDFWLGPAPKKPYNVKHVHYNFRFFWDYSGGQLTNWGAHHIDIAHWGLGMDDSGPISVSGEAIYHPEGWYEVPDRYALTYLYPGGVTLYCGQKEPGGTTFEGEKGKIQVNRGKLIVEPREIIDGPIPLGPKDTSTAHHQNWLQAIRDGSRPVADVEIGHRTATACHLGNIAARLGREIKWDASAQRIVGDEEAAAMLARPYREPWKLSVERA